MARSAAAQYGLRWHHGVTPLWLHATKFQPTYRAGMVTEKLQK
jgi:hypothetical protein